MPNHEVGLASPATTRPSAWHLCTHAHTHTYGTLCPNNQLSATAQCLLPPTPQTHSTFTTHYDHLLWNSRTMSCVITISGLAVSTPKCSAMAATSSAAVRPSCSRFSSRPRPAAPEPPLPPLPYRW